MNDVLKEEFKLPDSLEPINILAIGYADASVVKPAKDDTRPVSGSFM